MRNLSNSLVRLVRRGKTLNRSYLSIVRDHCLACDEAIGESSTYLTYRICPHCRFHYALTARERIALLVDDGSFKETNRAMSSVGPESLSRKTAYPSLLSQDQTRTGLTEACITGRCTIGEVKTYIAVLDFGFMGGSMGSVVGEKVAQAFEIAAKNGTPFVALVNGGGARMQEGVLSLLQMAKTVAAANRLRDKQIPFIVVLSNPSTGQAYASFANLADVILAEPGSLIGLAPMRTLKEESRKPVPPDAHTAEAHMKGGLIDNIVPRDALRDRLKTILEILGTDRQSNGARKWKKKQDQPSNGAADPARSLKMARHPRRPTARSYIQEMVDDFFELKGDRVSGDDTTMVGGLGHLNGGAVVIIGQDRTRGGRSNKYHTYPEGFRKARRLVDLASRFQLPVVTLVDTQGAHPGLESEEQGVGNAVATTLSLMAEAPTPIVSAIVGEGGSEAALALGIADSILMQRYAVFTPAPTAPTPSRLHKGLARNQTEPEELVLTAYDCKELGLIDEVVTEPDEGAHTDKSAAASELAEAITRNLALLGKTSLKKLLKNRYRKFRKMGESSAYYEAARRREVSLLQHIVEKDTGGRSKKGRKRAKEQVAAD